MNSVFSATIKRIGLLPWARLRNGRFQVMLPEWIYDLLVYVFFPINWMLSNLPARFPHHYNQKDWPLDSKLSPGDLRETELSLGEMKGIICRRNETRLRDDDVWALFDSLEAPGTNDIIGNWRGKVVNTGAWLNLAKYTLEFTLLLTGCDWGKRFFTPYRGDPLIFILWDRVVIPIPMWGSVSIPEIRFRGKVGAAMTYDHQPWKDHFRVLDNGRESGRRMLLGNWMAREKNGGWFTLEELPELNKPMADLFVKSPF